MCEMHQSAWQNWIYSWAAPGFCFLPCVSISWENGEKHLFSDWPNLRCASFWLALKCTPWVLKFPYRNNWNWTIFCHYLSKIMLQKLLVLVIIKCMSKPILTYGLATENMIAWSWGVVHKRGGALVSCRRRKAKGVWDIEVVVRVSTWGCFGKMSGFKTFLSSIFIFFLVECCLVGCDITDGNAEHLKREHSLTKPYQGKRS